MICAAALIGLLSAWVVTGGTGNIVAQQVQVTQAAVPMRAFTAAADPSGPAGTFLTIWNPGQKADELLSVSSPIAHRIVLVRRGGPEGPGTVVPELTIPAGGTLTLTPFGTDVVLRDPARYENDATVRLTLTFRRAGRISVTADVSAPGDTRDACRPAAAGHGPGSSGWPGGGGPDRSRYRGGPHSAGSAHYFLASLG